jgi:hypothetical protein
VDHPRGDRGATGRAAARDGHLKAQPQAPKRAPRALARRDPVAPEPDPRGRLIRSAFPQIRTKSAPSVSLYPLPYRLLQRLNSGSIQFDTAVPAPPKPPIGKVAQRAGTRSFWGEHRVTQTA